MKNLARKTQDIVRNGREIQRVESSYIKSGPPKVDMSE